MGTQLTTPANWYPDPNHPGTLRYWDGRQWTDHVTQGCSTRPRRPATGGPILSSTMSEVNSSHFSARKNERRNSSARIANYARHSTASAHST